ncbi:starvation-inducible outer membrane lipoprotein [Thioflavicoccus mobilis 8321]|uniref:Starvation-inducible outer membrane lipoprotein n=1 Tax=Thioflavicoccus mobilis 8321 TaxID=765912 RepID=L0H3X4_9GAMM|nr:Slp family lipoprotein [Thioflavicoccus mobilis]AGA92294.1 starvation-inducible outer membrane lipoprotein [Thioflavicoccus mobilis 8321]
MIDELILRLIQASAARAATGAVLVVALTGCATTGNCPEAIGERDLTPAAVTAAGTAGFTGQLVQWGGVLVEARNREERTELEVLGYPLDGCGRPRTQAASVGRFLIVKPGYLETADLRPGRLITASGRIIGTEAGRVADTPYRLPLLESFSPYLWPAEAAGGATPWRPWVTIGVGGGSGGVGGGVGVTF